MLTARMKPRVTVLFVTAGPVLPDPARTDPTDPAAFDGTWIVSLTGGGLVSGSLPEVTLTVRNGSVRGSSFGASVSGQVEPSGSVSLTLQKSGIRGSASGKLSEASGSGSWKVPSLGFSGRWTAQRRTLTAQTN